MENKKAVALKYPPGVEAPVIVAKGKGYAAEEIINTAQKHKIPLEENTGLVNMLEFETVGSIVPEESWQALAVIFSFILDRENEYKENR